MADLPFFVELSHGLDRLLNRSVSVCSMLVIQLDAVRVQTLEASFV
jgi:hypothetical protein